MSTYQNTSMKKMGKSGIPLAMVEPGQPYHVAAIRGKDDTQRFLQNLGFSEDAEVTLVSESSGNVIVNVKGTRIAISKAMAMRIVTV